MENTNFEDYKKAHKKIIALLEKTKDLHSFNIGNVKIKSINFLFGCELKLKYGYNIKPEDVNNSNDYYRYSDYVCFSTFKDGNGKQISWSDDGIQPKNETLLVISFPTGAYIFGKDYDTDLFNKMFIELKSYSPKYLDSANKSLYFSIEKGSEIFNNFDTIMKRYYDEYRNTENDRAIIRLKKELEKLQKNG